MGNRIVQCRSILKTKATNSFLPRKTQHSFPSTQIEEEGKLRFGELQVANPSWKGSTQRTRTRFANTAWEPFKTLKDCCIRLTARLPYSKTARKVRTTRTGRVMGDKTDLPEIAVIRWRGCIRTKLSGWVEQSDLKKS